MIKKLSQLKTNRMNSNSDKLDYMEFTVLDILNDIKWIKPLFLLFKKTRLVKNYDQYNALKKDLLERLQIEKITEQMTAIKITKKRVEEMDSLDEKVDDLERKIDSFIRR